MAEASPNQNQNARRFNEIPVILDDQTWIWNLVDTQLSHLSLAHVRLPSTVPLRQSWERLKHAFRLVIHWEAQGRSGGALIEEILDVQPNFDIGERIIVLTTNPTHEDVVYFSELGVRRIVRLRSRDKDLLEAGRELRHHLAILPGADQTTDHLEKVWRQFNHALDTLPEKVPPETLAKLEAILAQLRPKELTARFLDAAARVAMLRGENQAALKFWHQSLDKNPNYYRAYHGMILFHRRLGHHMEAMALMQKLHELNKQNISRLVGMGEIQMQLKDSLRAEFYFNAALDRDPWCSGALNGMAEIRFFQGDLDESRRLLARSQLAYKTAASLNQAGISMVTAGRHQEALEHYTRAQYVLPQHDKGPLLFYNIGLCYARWEKLTMAREFLKIALIKEPSYKKAQRLLVQVEERLGVTAA